LVSAAWSEALRGVEGNVRVFPARAAASRVEVLAARVGDPYVGRKPGLIADGIVPERGLERRLIRSLGPRGSVEALRVEADRDERPLPRWMGTCP
jgi:hypothetical protein